MINYLRNKDLDGVSKALAENPALANEGISFGDDDPGKVHPLHRLCDGVFNGWYSDGEGVEIARIFLRHGAAVNGIDIKDGQDTPLVAAASLHAEQVGLLYIDMGADIHHGGCYGGTALHWAAWTGRDRLVKRLIAENAEINRRCIEFAGTPLLWAVHGYRFGNGNNRHHQVDCVRILLEAGADKTIPNIEGTLPVEMAPDGDAALMELFR